jgi:hypothetical protein
MTESSSTSAAPDPALAPGAGGAYDELVSRSPQGSVFASSWWLDAVAPGTWRAHALERGGEVVAAWPTVVRAGRFGNVHVAPPLTPYLGPLLTPGEGAHRRSREIDQVEALLELLGSFAHLEASCSPAFDYWTPLHWQGFRQTSHYTWRLSDLRDRDAVFAGVRENVRREVRKARKRGLTVAEGSLADYLRVHDDTAVRQGRERVARVNEAVLARIDAAAGPRGARTILLARDADGRVHAGGYFVHDARWTYYLLGGSDAELRTSGGASLLIWGAIERAGGRGTGFDFEGSMLRHVERFVRSFGGVPTPYSLVRRTRSRPFAAARALKRAAFALGVRR